MTTTALKKELMRVIENIDDNRLLEAAYVLLSNSVPKKPYVLSENEIKIVAERSAEYKAGKTKTYTVDQVKKKILKKHGK